MGRTLLRSLHNKRYVPKGVGSCNVLVVNKQPFHFLTGVMESMHF
jgi:hypothetical protein